MIVEAQSPVGRKWRRPKHTFQIRARPYQIQPMFIAPVIPGETMKNLLVQARVVSDPVKHPLVGWWQEYYFFYVKHRDLAARDKLTAMMLNPQYDLSSEFSAADVPTYHYGSTINWTQKCLERVVEEYFRDEGEAWNAALLGTLPMAQAFGKQDSWLDSLTLDGAMPEIDPNDVSAQAADPQWAQWEFMRAQKLINMSYEDWLATFGIKTNQEVHKPELIRYLREWTYPSNTVDPTTGTPTSALSWSVSERADKDRFFREPGFLFGVTVTRPKVYMSKQTGSAVGLMNDAFSWLPALMRDEPYTSLKLVPNGTGPLPTVSDVGGYWVDVRDLLLYGDQFINFALTATDAALVAVPQTNGGTKYLTATDIDGLFKTSTVNLIKQDGVVSLAILGAQTDQT